MVLNPCVGSRMFRGNVHCRIAQTCVLGAGDFWGTCFSGQTRAFEGDRILEIALFWSNLRSEGRQVSETMPFWSKVLSEGKFKGKDSPGWSLLQLKHASDQGFCNRGYKQGGKQS